MDLTVRPSSLFPSMSSARQASSVFSSGFVTKSTETPLHPLRGVVGVPGCEGLGLLPADGAGDTFLAAIRRCALMFAKKSASYRFLAAIGTGVGRRSCVHELMLVCAVVTVPRLKSDDRSEPVVALDITDARLEPGGGFEIRDGGGGGGTRRMMFGVGEEGLGDCECEDERVELNVPAELCRDGCCGGSILTLIEKSFSHSCVKDRLGLETCSNEELTLSRSRS